MPIIALEDIKFDDNESGVVPLSSIKFDDEMSGEVVPLESIKFDDEPEPRRNILSDIGSGMAMESQYAGTPGRVAGASIAGLKTFIPSGLAGASGFIQSKGKTFDEKLSDAERARSLVADTIPNFLLKTPEEQKGAEIAGYVFKPIEWVGQAAEKVAKFLDLKYIPGDTLSPAGSPQGLNADDAISVEYAPVVAKIAGEMAALSLMPASVKKTNQLAKTANAINRYSKAAGIKKSIAFKNVMREAQNTAKTMESVASERATNHYLRALEEPEVESKIGEPLIMPRDRSGGEPIPKPLDTGVKEGAEDVRPVWEVKQESEAIAREKWLDAEIEKRKVIQKLADKGNVQAKEYLAKTEERFNTAWRERELLGKIKADESFQSEDVVPEREVSLRPDQRAAIVQKDFAPVDTNFPTKELTPEEVIERNRERINQEAKSFMQSRQKLLSDLDKNKPLAPESPLEKPSPVSSAGTLETPGQYPPGYGPMTVMAAELEAGDKFKIKGEEFKVKGVEDGRIVIEDGVKRKLLPDEDITIENLEKAPVAGEDLETRKQLQEAADKVGLRLDEGYGDTWSVTDTGITGSKTSKQVRTPEDVIAFAEVQKAKIPTQVGKVAKPEAESTNIVAEPTATSVSKPTLSEAPTIDISEKTGTDKAESPRKVSEIWQDVKTVMGDLERGSVSNKPMNENQIAAIERITEDARRAKKDIETYMREHGAKPEAIAKVLANRELYYKQKEAPVINQSPIITEPKQIINKFSEPKSSIIRDSMKGLDDALGVVSTRLGNIAPELKDTVKKHAAEVDIHTWTDLNKAKSFIEKGTKLSPEDQFKLTALLRNGQYDKDARTQMLAFLKEKDMLKDYAAVENVIADTLKRGLDSGMTIKEIKNFFPSHVKNYAGIRTVLGKDNIGKIDEAFTKEANKKGITVDELGDESKGAIIDSMMRGWSKNKIYLFDPYEVKTGIGKSRTLTTLTPELMQHYYPFHESLVKYIGSMNTAIANNNLFKKSRKIGKAIQMEGIDLPVGKSELSDSIGDIILDLKDKGKFSKDPNRAMEQEAELKHVLTSYMMPKSQGKYVTGLKNFTYNALLGNPMTALTQFQDVGITLSRHGVRNTIQGLGRMMTKNAEKLSDIGIDNFKADLERNTKMGKATKLNMAFLTLTDMFGKGLNMNANMVKTQRALKNPKYKPEIEAEIDRLFGEDAAQVKQDLLNNKKTLATNTFVHYNLAKHHPISKAEVPTGYLNGDKTRLLYMLHTYQIKQLDIFRNDVVNQIKAGNIAKGAYNMANLTAWLLACGVTVNAARDFIFKGDTKALDEYLTDSAWQITLVNRYLVDKGFREGVGSFLWNSVAPGTISIANDISKDLLLEDKKDKGLRSTKYIPLVGRPYYDIAGRGSVVRKEYKDKEKPKSKYGSLRGIQ